MKNCLSIMALLTFAAGASGGAILTVGSPYDFEPAGSLVEVDVTLFGLTTALDSYRFDIDFTPGALSALGTNAGTVEAIDNVGGTVGGLARSNIGMNFGGTLFRLYFKAIGPGNTFLSVPRSSVTLLDSGGNEISFTTAGGSVYVGGAAPIMAPEPRSLWLLLAGLTAMGATYLKKRRAVLN